MDSKLIVALVGLGFALSNAEAIDKKENKTEESNEEKNKDINKKIILKCDKLLDKLENSSITDKEKYIKAIQKIRDNFSKNSVEIRYLYKISVHQKVQKIAEYLSKLSSYVNKVSEQCEKVLDSSKKYDEKTLDEIKNKYKNFEK